ncbi:Fanconi anemia group M protein isoform X2 [Hemicordylus capensis]|uniref:Fanconi anemia group M protein isoform X2 n=1 Tax=Hemicordylus capensis TaxID=884348 RepID=UPI002303000E|nr:Fanconi anemia group M protein isoform X2 [Hemicordylus capensis]
MAPSASSAPRMMKRRQATLFQTWGARPASGPAADDDDDDDEALAAAALVAEAAAGGPGPVGGGASFSSSSSSSSFVGGPAGALWVYPWGGRVEERAYQVRAARAALEANTLLCLPTGLGKTLVAAVVMYNFYRWFPGGKVLFLAPTKPLVAQQREACAGLMGIPAAHMAEMTGGTQVVDREEIWCDKRIFFLTPQIMINDLTRGLCPAIDIKCLVIDEAHKALGNYAYCQVVKELCKYTQQFRILALTATPGSDAKAVQQVISNLLISHIELCSEDSPDIQPYSYERQVEKCIVPLGKELTDIQKAYIQVLENFAGRLIRFQVLSQREIPSLTKYQIILARDQFRKNPASHFVGAQQGVIEGDFALCISLYHGYELLLQMGMRSLYIFLRGIMDGSKGMTRAKNELGRNEDFMRLYSQLENMFADSAVTSANGSTKPGAENRKPFLYSHPKLKKLEDVVTEHFRSWKEHDQSTSEGKPLNTRVMIFSSFRDSVQEIAEMLSQHHPIVRVMTFVGHSTGKSTKGFTQREQLEVVRHFREGGYNTLVSTCVGEEGLDIGEVDLIICFDAQKSPIRLVQRMGRTGRKRRGRIVVILSEGREERTYNQSQSKRRSLLKAISENKGLHLYQHSPRMIPEGIQPKMHRMLITPAEVEPSIYRPSLKERRGHTPLKRWLPYSTGAGKKQVDSTEDWCLTADEFETWKRLYRLKPGEGIKQPVMPRGRFETLEDDEKNTESQANEAYELSLSEWRIWQNRPFPTHLVEHSDLCCHFISVMEMIEQMRHEEEECSYESKIQPYFHWEDVDDAPDVQQSKSSRGATVAQKVVSSRKGLVDASKAKRCSSSLEELDAECLSLFKAANFKSVKRFQALNVESGGLTKDDCGPLECFSANGHLPVEDAGNKRLPGKNKENMDEFTCTEGIPNHENAAREFPPAPENCSSWSGHSVDSGYSCFTEDNLLLSSPMFYFPAPERDSFVLSARSADEDPSCETDILINVARLLSQSPPSLNELLDFERENEALWLDSMQKSVPGVCAENSPPEKLTYFSEFQNSSRPPRNTSEFLDSHKQPSSHNWPLETSSITEAFVSKRSVDLNWDAIFDLEDEEQIGIQVGNLSVANHGPTKNPLQSDAGGGHQGPSNKRTGGNMSPDEEVSINLFEEDLFPESNHPPYGKGTKLSVLSDVCSRTNTPTNEAGISEQPPSEEIVTISHANPSSPLIINSVECLEAAGDLDHASEPQLQHHEELYDVSQDLFSVNFDLGFSFEGLEDETSQQVSIVKDGGGHVAFQSVNAEDTPTNSSLAKKSPLTWSNECLDKTKFSTPLPLQKNCNSRLVTTENVPVASPLTIGGEKLCQSPHSEKVAFSTPTGRLRMRVRASRGAYMSSDSRNGHESPSFAVPSKTNTSTVKKVLASSAFNTDCSASKRSGNGGNKNQDGSSVLSAERASSESEEEIVFLRKNKRKGNVLTSPMINNSHNFESPVHAVRKRKRPLIMSDLSSDGSPDFSEKSNRRLDDTRGSKKQVKGVKRQKRRGSSVIKNAAKEFIDEEAEISEEETVEVSSDEPADSENELSSSLDRFLDDETEITQALNESEMQAVYLKSLRSPAVGNRYKMVHKPRNLMAVFSQVPEQDESYMADSFCVGEEEEEVEEVHLQSSSEEDEVCVNFELLQEESFVTGRKQYCTRRRKKLKEDHLEQRQGAPLLPKKPSRIQVLDDSSEDEGGTRNGLPKEPPTNTNADVGSRLVSSLTMDHSTSVQKTPVHPLQDRRAQALLNLKAAVSEELDFHSPFKDQGRSELLCGDLQTTFKPERSLGHLPALCSAPAPRNRRPLCILADSREISSGPDVISTLKAVHGVKVQVCSLSGCDYVVSNRLAVERRCQGEMLNSAHRSKMAQRVQQLKSKFDRICVIVEKERVKAGETWRVFHRTKHYDGMLSAFIRAGIRVLFSSCQEETADLLKELALVEQRKNAAIFTPTEGKGPAQDALRFYLSIPCVSYPMALALCHYFGSVKEMANSSPSEMAAGTQVNLQKAEEVHHYIRYAFDAQMLLEKVT